MAVLTSEQDVEPFLNRETVVSDLPNLRKDELLLISDYFELNFTKTSKKADILAAVLDSLGVSQAEEADPGKPPTPVAEGLEASMQEVDGELEKLKLQLEFRKLEAASREKELAFTSARDERQREKEERDRQERIEERERDRQHELELARLSISSTRSEQGTHFNVCKFIKLVPRFNEKEVSKFFESFEKVASQLKWPKDYWAIMLQAVLTGKAQVAYSSMSAEESASYDKVKQAILKAYELVPEAYRQKFRDLRKIPGQTYMDFAKQKERLFEEWCKSKDVSEFDSLRELLLLEEFKNCVPLEIKTHLEEVQVESLGNAAKFADEYILTHKNFGKSDHKKPSFQKKSSSKDDSTSDGDNKKEITCFQCGKKGHVKANCLKFKGSSVKNTMLVNTREKLSSVQNRLDSLKGNSTLEEFKPFLSEGRVQLLGTTGGPVRVAMLRDTGAAQLLIVEASLPADFKVTDECVLIGGFPDSLVTCPLLQVYLDSELIKGCFKVAIVQSLPIEGVDMILANDIAKGRVVTEPLLVSKPRIEVGRFNLDGNDPVPVNVVTRAQGKKDSVGDISLNTLFNGVDQVSLKDNYDEKLKVNDIDWSRDTLIREQKGDPEISKLRSAAEGDDKVFFIDKGVLMRHYVPISANNDEWLKSDQIVVPPKFREVILKRAHENAFSAYLGIGKTLNRISRNFFWPKSKKDVVGHCKTCHQCQIAGKPNQSIPKAPLVPIPSVGEPFEHIIIDIVGPLPKSSSGAEYLLTIMDRFSRFPEAIPIRSIKAPNIIKHLMHFFSRFGLPKTIQSDQGSNFMSHCFKNQLKEWGIKHIVASPYHAQSQGALERFHQTLKAMMRKFCLNVSKSWEGDLPFLLFAIRSVPNESLGLSPFEVVFGHNVRGPLDVLRESWEEANINPEHIGEWLSKTRGKLYSAWGMVRENLIKAQTKMKAMYDFKSKSRQFHKGDSVLVLLPVPGDPLHAKFMGPYTIEKKVNETNYVINTPDRINPTKAKIITDEVDYMLTNKLIKPSFSPWSSPVVLVPKPNNQFRLCLDYRKVNAITKTDSYPLPRVDDCVDRIGNAQFISKFDLLKGYWQVPLTERAKEISAFVTHNGLYQCSVMPFGMKNAASTFQRLMNIVCSKVKNCVVYIDDVVIYSNSWEDHLQSIQELLKAIQNANLVINLAKSDFSQAKITYLGFEVGYGKVLPKESNIQAILDFPVPKTRKNIRQFIGLAGYYRKFVLNFSDIVCPLTNLLKKNVNFNWDDSCDISFNKLKSILISHPVLTSPNFSRDFELSIDASDTGIGAMLCQKDDLGESHPVAFFSKKLNEPQRKYSTIEKET